MLDVDLFLHLEVSAGLQMQGGKRRKTKKDRDGHMGRRRRTGDRCVLRRVGASEDYTLAPITCPCPGYPPAG